MSPPAPESPAARWLKSNLATVGSAAVFAVYAAGWARTKEAADALEEQSNQAPLRRRAVALQATGQIDETPRPRPTGDARQAMVDSASSVAATAPKPTLEAVAKPVAEKTAEKPVTAKADKAVAETQVAAKPATSPGSTTVAPALVASAPTTQAASPVAASPAPASPQPATPTASSATAKPSAPDVPSSSDTRPPDRELATTNVATVPASAGAGTDADPDAPIVYKDGLYSGWGSSRHGDIEAYVEIKEGRIKSAFISECLTQYDCSWIAKLPPEVVRYQGSDIDYISGATQSSNAFYYAVVAALKKAQAK